MQTFIGSDLYDCDTKAYLKSIHITEHHKPDDKNFYHLPQVLGEEQC